MEIAKIKILYLVVAIFMTIGFVFGCSSNKNTQDLNPNPPTDENGNNSENSGGDENENGNGNENTDFSATNYLSDVYINLKDNNHVFESITYERLVKVLQTDGTSIIVFASPLNKSSQDILPIINETAKTKGIGKVYHFDPHIGFDPTIKNSDGFVDNTQFGIVDIIADTQKPYSQFYNNLLNGYDTPALLASSYRNKGALLKNLDSNYFSSDTLLFAYNRKGDSVDASFASNGSEILGSALITQATTQESATTNVVNVLSQIVNDDQIVDGQFEFFKNWNYGTSAIASPVTDKHKEKFSLQSVTYPELIYILNKQGQHDILFSGSWCPDSRAAVGYIAENASKYSNNPVYVFDFRLDSGVTNSFNFTLGQTEYSYTSSKLSVLSNNQDNPALTAHLGAKIIDLFGKFNSGNNTASWYYPDGDETKTLKEFSNKKTRSPYLARYDKDATSGVIGQDSKIIKEWLHEIKDYETPYGSEWQEVGSLVDYEFASGELTAEQKAQGRVAIGDFFSGSSITYSPKKIVISESDNDKTGCGDDDEPAYDSGSETLYPYSGTNEYDAINYDISVEFFPEKENAEDAFLLTTIITAKANQDIQTLYLDFRNLAVQSVKLDGNSFSFTDKAIIENNHYVSRHNSDTNYHKLILKPENKIISGTTFIVEVTYTTGFVDTFIAKGKSAQGFSKSLHGLGGAVLGEPFGATYWFPSNNIPADGATFTFNLTAPNEFLSTASGQRITKQINGSKTTIVWQLTTQTAPYQVFSAFSNDWLEFTNKTNTAPYNIKPITTENGDKLDVYIYVSKTIYNQNNNRNRDKIDLYINKFSYYINELEKIAGIYPGESLGFVFDNLSDGTGESAQWGAVEVKDRPFYTTSNVIGEPTFVHELLHQWFGNSVRPLTWKDLWLNEGFATYLTDVFYENTSNYNVQGVYKVLYDKTTSTSKLWLSGTADIKLESDLFGGARIPYHRGALSLASLRESLGDKEFFKIIRNWNNKETDSTVAGYYNKAVSTTDFISFAQNLSNKNLQLITNDWLYGTVRPTQFKYNLVSLAN